MSAAPPPTVSWRAFRPRYETAEHRLDEMAMAQRLSAAWKCEVVKLPVAYHLDYAAIRGKRVVAWLELKRRNRGLHEQTCVYLSVQKVFAARQCHDLTELPCLFVAQFTDCLAYANMLPQRPIHFMGRRDRGDWQDREPVVVIGPDAFRIVKAADDVRILA